MVFCTALKLNAIYVYKNVYIITFKEHIAQSEDLISPEEYHMLLKYILFPTAKKELNNRDKAILRKSFLLLTNVNKLMPKKEAPTNRTAGTLSLK